MNLHLNSNPHSIDYLESEINRSVDLLLEISNIIPYSPYQRLLL